MFLDQTDLDFRRDRADTLFGLFGRMLADGHDRSDVKQAIMALTARPYSNMAPEEIEGLLERLNLQSA